MKKIITLLMIAALIGCQEEITQIVELNDNGNSSGGVTSGGGTLPVVPVAGKYANCLSVLSDTTLDIVTWNIEHFPKSGATTISLLKEMILTMSPDVIALQEIESTPNFTTLLSELPGYTGVLAPGSGQRLAFIYKTAEITAIVPAVEIFTGEPGPFPRAPFKTTITHVSGEVVTLINVHLKCCDDSGVTYGSSIDRRKAAMTKIKDYIDTSLPTASVVVLGDYNEDLTEPEGNGVFTTLINDAGDYKFADMGIATGSTSNFSYQSVEYLSHLDHMLITNELFDNLDGARTIKFSTCEGAYISDLTDHYPVMMRLKSLD